MTVNDVNVNDCQDDVNVEDVEANVNMEDDESGTDPNYEESEEDDDESETRPNLGPDVSVDWTTVLPNEKIEHTSKYNIIFDNESYDSDELHTPLESDVEDETERFLTFKENNIFELA
ncbi:unnamed protein product [Vicia faba]|uniref:Uncharacterized protein n=1 Tax=Vicia faba TaxID=3906 RepID=A0AAV0ZM43_VICFA|nr:unnamed protein product [Vicia faba]